MKKKHMFGLFDRAQIMQAIFDEFHQMIQWLMNSPGDYAAHAKKAEALIELLEVEDCGSIGGFDEKNPKVLDTDSDLYNRFLTLYNKEKVKLKSQCGYSPIRMTQFWRAVGMVQDKVLEQK